MDQLISAKYTSFAADDVDYPNVSSITKKGTAPKPKSTIAADSISLAREKKIEKVRRLTHLACYIIMCTISGKGVVHVDLMKRPIYFLLERHTTKVGNSR